MTFCYRLMHENMIFQYYTVFASENNVLNFQETINGIGMNVAFATGLH